MIDFQEAIVGMAIRISFFDEVFKEYYRVNQLESIDFQIDPSDPNSLVIPIELNPPDLIFDRERDPDVFLHMSGQFPHPLLPDNIVPVDLEIDLPFATRTTSAEVAKLILDYQGIASINPELDTLLTPFVNGATPQERLESLSELFANNAIIEAITSLELDIFRPLVEGLSEALFSDDDAPLDNTWGTAIRTLPGEDEQTESAIGLFVSMPGDFPFPGVTESFLPSSHSMVLAYSRTFLDQVLEAGAQAQIGEKIDGAEITRLNLSMNDDSIQVDGEVKKSVAKITFVGPLHPQLIRGDGTILIDASDVDVDVPEALIGFLKFLGVLSAISFFGIAALGKITDAISDLENADEAVQIGLTDSLQKALLALTDGLKFSSDIGEVSVISTIDELQVVDGNFLFLSHLFAGPQTDRILQAFYSKELRKFVLFHLESGLRFSATDLAKLIQAEKIIIEGVHDVNGVYVRTDPDMTLENNLLEIFADLAPDEPTVEDLPME